MSGELCAGCMNLKSGPKCSKGHKIFMTKGYGDVNTPYTACNGCYRSKPGLF